MKNIAVFCGARIGHHKTYQEAAIQFAKTLAEQQMTLVYGGARVGIMGILADHVLSQGGEVIGVIPTHLDEIEIVHQDITKLHVVSSMAARKSLMIELADAFVLLPGGAGSLDEFFEVLTLSYLNQHQKPIAILNIENYYDHIIHFFNHGASEGFIIQEIIQQIFITKDINKLFDYLKKFTPLKSIKQA